MRKSLRSAMVVVTVSVLTVAFTPLSSVRADEARTETNLAGFSVDVQASPILVLLDDPKAAIPRPTGTAVVEADPNFTLASVAAGPNARAVASTVWPGNLFGEGLPAIDPRIPPYPLKAESRYPDQPYTANGPDGGALTHSSALGLDAFAQADAIPLNTPGAIPLTVGGVTSTSKATVTEKDVALGTSVSAVQDINLLGVIHIGSVTTRLTSSADGKTPSATGSTTVAGLTIAGNSFSVDETGLHAGPSSNKLPDLATPDQVRDALGISVHAIVQGNSKSGDGATSTASGLVINVDTKVYKAALKTPTDAIRPIYSQLVNAFPPQCQCQGQFYYLLNATPNLTFVFGSGSTSSAATLPISFEFPPPPSFPQGPIGSSGGGPVAAGPLPGLGDPPPGGGTVVPPVLQPPGGRMPGVAMAAATSAGMSAAWVLGALIGSALIGWALLRFLGAAGGLLGFGCRLGAPTSVPDLRSVTA